MTKMFTKGKLAQYKSLVLTRIRSLSTSLTISEMVMHPLAMSVPSAHLMQVVFDAGRADAHDASQLFCTLVGIRYDQVAEVIHVELV